MSTTHSTASPFVLNVVIAPIIEPVMDIPMDVEVDLDNEVEQIEKEAQLKEQKVAEAVEKAQQVVWDVKTTWDKCRVDQKNEQEEPEKAQLEAEKKELAQIEVEKAIERAPIIAISPSF